MPATVRRRAQACIATTVLGLAAAVLPIASAAVAAGRPARLPCIMSNATVTAAIAAGAAWIARDINRTGRSSTPSLTKQAPETPRTPSWL